jgi:phosphoglycolate phosphatase
LFDLDGTLIDSEAGIVASTEFALARLGAAIPSRAVLRSWIGSPLRVTFPQVLGDDHVAVERAVAFYRERFSAVGWREHTVYAGVADAIEALAAQGMALAVVTSKPDLYAPRIVESLAFGRRFARVYCVHAGSSRSEKADMIAQALREFNVAPGDAVMVGDRHLDVEGARANGVRCIGVTWGFGGVDELRAAGADALAHTPDGLVKLLGGAMPTS